MKHRRILQSGLSFIAAFFLLAAPLSSDAQGQGGKPNPSPSPTKPIRGTPKSSQKPPQEAKNAFPKITEKEPGGFLADPSYLQRFSYASSNLKVKIRTNTALPRFNTLEQLDKERRDRLELRPLLPPAESTYSPAGGGQPGPRPEPTPLFSL